ncbi:hypothetical protein [Azoarcus olearius]|uniref:Conserved hypothetical membrane protein n=1 Tax=Azoarcus sp. (strain BH72) TaxID=418699 RepID=A1K8R7_AZOSB|nr:hypothetical protein [Azoarcus olearius]ANQ85795.1 hypothetical protein dqs_2766 [Azoarcus olearius]CAL95222.1 conserved hypothetical membrane protein [Azoarcus olearius]
MSEYRHYVSGFFADREHAERTRAQLLERGLPAAQTNIYATEPGLPPPAEPPKSKAVLKDVLVDGAIGTAVGTGVGALAQLALVAANVTLFVASPLIAPLAMLGWGASLGGLIGTVVGAESRKGPFSDLVKDAIDSGQTVLVVETHDEQQTALAEEVIHAAIGEHDPSIKAGLY